MRKVNKILKTYAYEMAFLLVLIPFLPLLVLQGKRVRRLTLRLPDAKGPNHGTIGEGRPLSITLIGASTVMGVGARAQERALSGFLALGLSKASAAQVRWQSFGKTGIRLDRMMSDYAHVPAGTDATIVVAGVNEASALWSLRKWNKSITEMSKSIRKTYSGKMFFTSLPPMHLFTALPQPLRFVLGLKARALDCAMQIHPEEGKNFHYLATPMTPRAEYLCEDGFHPSESGYDVIGQAIGKELSNFLSHTVVVFDFDGVIFDSFQHGIDLMRELSGPHRFKYVRDEDIEHLRSLNTRGILKELGLSNWRIPFVVKDMRRLMNQRLTKTHCFPEVKAAIAELRRNGIVCGVVSSNSSKNIKTLIERDGIEMDFVMGGVSLFGKVSKLAKIRQSILSKNRDVRLFYVGDETRDVVAANKTGYRSVAVSWGFNSRVALEREHPDVICDRPSEMLSQFLS